MKREGEGERERHKVGGRQRERKENLVGNSSHFFLFFSPLQNPFQASLYGRRQRRKALRAWLPHWVPEGGL